MSSHSAWAGMAVRNAETEISVSMFLFMFLRRYAYITHDILLYRHNVLYAAEGC